MNIKNILNSPIRKEIALSGIFRALTMIFSFLQVPIILNLITQTEYGIWITIFSIMGWLSIFDLGIGNGFKNQLTAAIAQEDLIKVKYLISSAVLMLSSIFLIIGIILLSATLIIDFESVFKLSNERIPDFKIILQILIVGICFNMATMIIHNILAAFQKTSYTIGIIFFQQFVICILLLIGKNLYNNKLIWIALVMSLIPGFINLIAAFMFYKTKKLDELIPSIFFLDRKVMKQITHLGFKFFIIQSATIILFSTDSYLISRFFSPGEVVPYNLAFRYFGLILTMFGIISIPFWSAFTKALTLKNYKWIKVAMNKLFLIGLLQVPIIILMIYVAPNVYYIWVGDKIEVQFMFNLVFGVYAFVGIVNSILSTFVNGTGHLNTQFWVAIIGAIINIPLSIFLSKYVNLGVIGIALATIFCQLIATFFLVKQYLLFYNYDQE